MRRLTLFAACVLMTACSSAPDRDGAIDAAQTASAVLPFVGSTWLSTDGDAAPGTIRIFLTDGTLVMTSCVETYRLAQWRSVGPGRIEWREESAVIGAEVSQPGDDELRLRLQLVREVRTETYRRATVPFVCPDLPR